MANPVLSSSRFADATAAPGEGTMTLSGTIVKTGLLMGFCALTAVGVVVTATNPPSDGTQGLVFVAAIAGLIVGLVGSFVPRWAAITAPLYAILEGVVLGGTAVIFNTIKGYAGLPVTALVLTLLIGFIMLALYATRLVHVTQRFRAVITSAILGIMAYYVVAFIAGLFGTHLPLMYDSGWLSIGFSVFVVCVASASFLLDFDAIERASQHGAPHYFEWYGAFGILVTFIWLYFEILRLLAKVAGRRR
ncbi:MAG TPA: Bax inhibitor-1/YccA family protein [Gemmatimonadales bacterium]|jgi:uncharacterized YccA/Bax inhibitor family protein|nr:Bax inhibitor-1/YccA family protein [Gemmatimonadales bacterium]